MPRNTREIDLEAEYDRLTDEMDDYAEQYHEAENGSNYQQLAASQGRTHEDYRSGVAWALDYPDSDADGSGWDVDSVSVGALTKGERNRVDAAVEQLDCVRQDAIVAVGTVDAPFLEHDPDDISQTPYHRTIRAVTQLDPHLVDWLDDRIDSVGSAGDTGKSFMESVMAEASGTSQNQNG